MGGVTRQHEAKLTHDSRAWGNKVHDNNISLEHEGLDRIVGLVDRDRTKRWEKIRNQSVSENRRNIGEVGWVGMRSEMKNGTGFNRHV